MLRRLSSGPIRNDERILYLWSSLGEVLACLSLASEFLFIEDGRT
jgi:hypothetical protein